MWSRKLLLAFCLVFCLSQLYATPSFTIDWTKLDNSLTQLEFNFQLLQTDNQNLQKYSEEMEKYSANQALQLVESEAKLQSLEKVTQRWKTYSLVISAVAISEGLVIYILSK